jgi:hypothetical protein
MVAPTLSDEELLAAVDAVALHGNVSRAAMTLGIPRATLQARFDRARARFDMQGMRIDRLHARIGMNVESADVIVFSDCHYWPGAPSTAHRALLEAIKEFKPRIVVANGDVFDGASISRHPRIGWDTTPTVREELKAVDERMTEVEEAAGGAELIWPLGNHDARYETFLAANAPQYEGVAGFSLKDHFPRWKPCWRLDINAGMDSHTIIKHQMRNGVHASRNNTVNAGVNTVTGHLHQLKITPVTDARGTRYGVDTGTLADIPGDQFVNYMEDGVADWRSGFAILHYRQGRMLPPELVQVAAPGVVEFRGKEYAV